LAFLLRSLIKDDDAVLLELERLLESGGHLQQRARHFGLIPPLPNLAARHCERGGQLDRPLFGLRAQSGDLALGLDRSDAGDRDQVDQILA